MNGDVVFADGGTAVAQNQPAISQTAPPPPSDRLFPGPAGFRPIAFSVIPRKKFARTEDGLSRIHDRGTSNG